MNCNHFSLDEIIADAKKKEQERRSNNQTGDKVNPLAFALDDYIKLKKIEAVQGSTGKIIKPKVTNQGTSEFEPSKDDIFKSLETIIEERGIAKVPHSKSTGKKSSMTYGEFKKRKFNNEEMEVEVDDNTITVVDPNDNEEEGNTLQKRKWSARAPEQDRFAFKPLEFITTPYRAVGFLSEKGMIIEMEVGKLSDPDDHEDRSHLWRCKVKCGGIAGVCDSERKTVAREVACQDFLVNLKAEYPLGKIPKYSVPKEILIDPAILQRVDEKAAEHGIALSHQVIIDAEIADRAKKRKKDADHTYQCSYSIGSEEFVATNRFLEYAKVNAALQAYEHITGEAFPLTKYFTGKECGEDIQYDYIESEVHQTVDGDDVEGRTTND